MIIAMNDKGLFGKDVEAFDKKRFTEDNAHAASPGTGPVCEKCGTCKHIARSERYRKCNLMRKFWTHGTGTDVLCKDKACSFWKADK